MAHLRFSGCLLFVAVLLVAVRAEEECLYGKINCYECSSETNKNCGDPFNTTGMHTIKHCEGCCVKMVTNRNTPQEVVRRTCTRDIDINLFIVDHVCMDASDGKGHMCFCETSLCNSSPPLHHSLFAHSFVFRHIVLFSGSLWLASQLNQFI